MKISKLAAMAMMFGAMAGTDGDMNTKHQFMDDTPPLSDEQKEQLRIERLKSKGLKEFWIKGECIVALNQKSAMKKYKKLKL